MKTLNWFYEHPEYMMVTAHRGASYEFPENTLLAMREAVASGADMIEFDINNSLDDVPVIIHDETIDRTSNGTGEVFKHTLAELKSYNFSYYLQGKRRFSPAYPKVEIPTFEELLDEFHGKVCMNIQAYADSPKATLEICRLFKKYDMYETAYISVLPFMADQIVAIDKDMEICLLPPWRERAKLDKVRMCREKYHSRFAQPVIQNTPETDAEIVDALKLMKEIGMRANLFFIDDKETVEKYRAMGMQGFLTNKGPEMVNYIRG